MEQKEILVAILGHFRDIILYSLVKLGNRDRLKQNKQVLAYFVTEFIIDTTLSDNLSTLSSLGSGIPNYI
jgi:hypothetical protein